MGHKKKPKNIVFFKDEVIKKHEAENLLNGLKDTVPKREKTEKQEENEIGLSKAEKKRRKKLKKQEQEIKGESEKLNEQIEVNLEHIPKKVKKNKRKHEDESTESLPDIEEENVPKKNKKAKKDKRVHVINEEEPLSAKKSKKKKNKEDGNHNDENETNDNDIPDKEDDNDSSKKPKPESKRSLKRKKHVKLLEEKKDKAVLKMQENVLNYLSKWKHARTEWKFEKLKQIWLQHHLFIVDRIPEEFWNIVVEYFNDSKGFIRRVVLREALKIIDEEDKAEGENDDENYQTRLRRARDIVQCLEE